MKDKRFDTIARIVAFVAAAAIVFLLGNLSGRCSAANTQQETSSAQVETSAGSGAGSETSSGSSWEQGSGAGSEASSGSSWEQSSEESSGPSWEQSGGQQASEAEPALTTQLEVYEDGHYTSKEEVALYIHLYDHLPSNFISKTKAKKAGWVPSKGNLQEVCPGMSIGGSVFYNDDGKLPDAQGRTWTECDINYEGGRRGAERIVFSNDGLIFYTADHYETFTQLY